MQNYNPKKNEKEFFTEMAEANAQLIAAAPELLEALQSFVDYLDSNLSEAEILLKNKAQRAINKATI